MSFLNKKFQQLIFGICLDLIGIMSYFLPGIGPVLDLIWAPIAGWLMAKMYPGKTGKVAAVVAFLEEILPGTDLIPSFTLMWFFNYILRKQ
jgi:hypothetical protein